MTSMAEIYTSCTPFLDAYVHETSFRMTLITPSKLVLKIARRLPSNADGYKQFTKYSKVGSPGGAVWVGLGNTGVTAVREDCEAEGGLLE